MPARPHTTPLVQTCPVAAVGKQKLKWLSAICNSVQSVFSVCVQFKHATVCALLRMQCAMCTLQSVHLHECNICSRWDTHSHIGDLHLNTTPQKFQASSVQIWKVWKYLQKCPWETSWPVFKLIYIVNLIQKFGEKLFLLLESHCLSVRPSMCDCFTPSNAHA